MALVPGHDDRDPSQVALVVPPEWYGDTTNHITVEPIVIRTDFWLN